MVISGAVQRELPIASFVDTKSHWKIPEESGVRGKTGTYYLTNYGEDTKALKKELSNNKKKSTVL